MQHYRGNCHVEGDICDGYRNNTEIDRSIWSVKDEVIKNVHNALLHLGKWSIKMYINHLNALNSLKESF